MRPPPSTLSAGDILGGRYQIKAALGEGGIGVVYACIDTKMEVQRAIKVIARRKNFDERLLERFLAEARVMARLQHPHILPVFDAGSDGNAFWYVSQLAELGMARTWLDSQPAAERTLLACEAVAQTLTGLAHAHSRGVVHRDVKPENVLVTGHRHFKLGDFGAARFSNSPLHLTATGDALGTVAYTAPEQEVDPRDATPASDIYGAGATLFRLCQGRPGAPPLLHLVELRPKQHPQLSSGLIQVIRRATRLLPESRYASATEMVEELRHEMSLLGM